MCGLAAFIGPHPNPTAIYRAVRMLDHRGPDASGIYVSRSGWATLAHNRLSILDLTSDGNQPMSDPTGRYHLIFNGEIYNYLELRKQLAHRWQFRTQTDTEVLLASLVLDGEAALSNFIGMFSFVLWDEHKRVAFAARDRFGVKPLYYHTTPAGLLYLASEIKALHVAGVQREIDQSTWATYLVHGVYDNSEATFWSEIKSLGAGECLYWKDHQVQVRQWYDLASEVSDDVDERSDEVVCNEYLDLLLDSVSLRVRSDVPVGMNLSGGLDSSLLLGLVRKYCSNISAISAFTFTSGDPSYDELPFVMELLAGSDQELIECQLTPQEVPALTESICHFQDEPFGGLPTAAYAKLFQMARERGCVVLLDGQGMDEQWAGYDYYRDVAFGKPI